MNKRVLGTIIAPLVMPLIGIALTIETCISGKHLDLACLETVGEYGIFLGAYMVPVSLVFLVFVGIPILKFLSHKIHLNIYRVTVIGAVTGFFLCTLVYLIATQHLPSVYVSRAFLSLISGGLIAMIYWLIASSTYENRNITKQPNE